MGQYYMPVVMDGNKVEKFYSHKYGNGLKLMEHSWIGNDFVNAVMAHMTEKPKRLVWLGDYADCCFDLIWNKEFVKDEAGFEGFWRKVWDDEADRFPEGEDMGFDMAPGSVYLVNFSKMEYVSISNYMKRVDGALIFCGKSTDDTWYVNPLPLLTCVGNGQGGGDYYSPIGADQIGRWAFDEILVTDDSVDIPADFVENVTIFME